MYHRLKMLVKRVTFLRRQQIQLSIDARPRHWRSGPGGKPRQRYVEFFGNPFEIGSLHADANFPISYRAACDAEALGEIGLSREAEDFFSEHPYALAECMIRMRWLLDCR